MIPNSDLIDVINPQDPIEIRVPRAALIAMAGFISCSVISAREIETNFASVDKYRNHMWEEAIGRLREFNALHGVNESSAQDDVLMEAAITAVFQDLEASGRIQRN